MSQKLKILLASPKKEFRDQNYEFLRNTPHDIQVISDSLAVLRTSVVAEINPDVAILDFGHILPPDEIGLTRFLKEYSGKTRFILITGYRDKYSGLDEHPRVILHFNGARATPDAIRHALTLRKREEVLV